MKTMKATIIAFLLCAISHIVEAQTPSNVAQPITMPIVMRQNYAASLFNLSIARAPDRLVLSAEPPLELPLRANNGTVIGSIVGGVVGAIGGGLYAYFWFEHRKGSAENTNELLVSSVVMVEILHLAIVLLGMSVGGLFGSMIGGIVGTVIGNANGYMISIAF